MSRTVLLAPLLAAGFQICGLAPSAAGFDVPRPPMTLSPDPGGRGAPGNAIVGDRTPSGVMIGQPPRVTAAERAINPKFLPTEVRYAGKETPGTIVIDTNHRFLYLVLDNGKAKRYGVGVGRPGFEWAGVHTVTSKAEWPTWTPPEDMRKRQPYLPQTMQGGPNNPLGARALYLGDTLYRIHGSNQPWTIGRAVSSGCIRMRNDDVIDLYQRVPVGTKVVVI